MDILWFFFSKKVRNLNSQSIHIKKAALNKLLFLFKSNCDN